MKNWNVDAVIAGGGPAGLTAAETIAARGCSVLVLEEDKEIGAPTRTSGGTFIEDMRALGVPERLYHPVRVCHFLSPNNGTRFEFAEPLGCILDVRSMFQHLAEKAAHSGAHVRPAAQVTGLLRDGGRITGVQAKFVNQPFDVQARVVIDATGYRAALARQAGLHGGAKRFGVGAELDLYAPHFPQDECWCILGNRFAPNGYAWFAPWGRNRVRAGVGVIHPDSNQHPEPLLELLVERAAEFGADLRGAQPIEYHYGLIPSDGVAEPFTRDGMVAVGDAANQASTLLGEGIRWAMLAGQLAGGVVADALQQGDCSARALGRYEREWNARFGRDLHIAQQINRRIATYTDAQWDEKVELLKQLQPEEVVRMMRSDFSVSSLARLAFAHPGLLKTGFRKLGQFVGV
jgi:digeranylgeranylglycerophospholipid reductase